MTKRHNWVALQPRLRKLADAGLTLQEAADALGVSRPTMDKHTKRMGIRDWFPYRKSETVVYRGVRDSMTGHAKRHGVPKGTAIERVRAMRVSGKPIDWDRIFAPPGSLRFKDLPEEIYERFDEAMEQRKAARRELRQLTIRAISRKMGLDEKLLSSAVRTGVKDPSFSDDEWRLVCMMMEERRRLEKVLAGATVARLSKSLGIPSSRAATLLRAAKADDKELT